MQYDKDIDIEEFIEELDTTILHTILNDIRNGTLLVEADDETVEMVLIQLWEMRESYERAGIIIGVT